jgi:hypothetical protein
MSEEIRRRGPSRGAAPRQICEQAMPSKCGFLRPASSSDKRRPTVCDDRHDRRARIAASAPRLSNFPEFHAGFTLAAAPRLSL